MTDANTIRPYDISAAFDWWREAGVDCVFADDVTDWLADTATQAPSTPPAVAIAAAASATLDRTSEEVENRRPIPNLMGDTPPPDLAQFRSWWLGEPGLDSIGPRGRIAAEGLAGAELMVLVMDPEQGDRDALLTQSQGRLLDAMLRAMSLTRSKIYLASALPRHTPMADGNAMVAAGFGTILRHHIGLVAPKRIIAFGNNTLPLLGHDVAQDPARFHKFEHDSGVAPLMWSEGLESMIAMPRLKARFWRRWLEWTGN